MNKNKMVSPQRRTGLQWYEAKVSRDGGKKGKAVTAVMRKIAKGLQHCCRTEEKFECAKVFQDKRQKKPRRRRRHGVGGVSARCRRGIGGVSAVGGNKVPRSKVPVGDNKVPRTQTAVGGKRVPIESGVAEVEALGGVHGET